MDGFLAFCDWDRGRPGGGKRELSVELSVTYTVIYCKKYRRFCQFDLSILSASGSILYGFMEPAR